MNLKWWLSIGSINVRQTGYSFSLSLSSLKKREGENKNELAKPVIINKFLFLIHLIITYQRVTFCRDIIVCSPFLFSLQEKEVRELRERIVHKVTLCYSFNKICYSFLFTDIVFILIRFYIVNLLKMYVR